MKYTNAQNFEGSSLNCSDWKIDSRLGNLMADHLTISPAAFKHFFFSGPANFKARNLLINNSLKKKLKKIL